MGGGVFLFLKKYPFLLLLLFLSLVLYVILNGITIQLITPLVSIIFSNNASPPILLEGLTSWILKGDKIYSLTRFTIFLFLLFILRGIFFFSLLFSGRLLEEKLLKDIRWSVYNHILSLPIPYLRKRKEGDFLSILLNDVENIRFFVSDGIVEFTKSLLLILVYLSLSLWASWRLFLTVSMVIPMVFIFTGWCGKRIRDISIEVQKRKGSVNSSLSDALKSPRVLKLYLREFMHRFSIENRILYSSSKNLWRYFSLSPSLNEVFSALVACLVLFYGGFLIIHGLLPLDRFFIFLASSISCIRPMKILGRSRGFIERGRACFIRVKEVMDMEREKEDGDRIDRIEEIVFRDVSYESDGKRILDKVNLRVKKGEWINVRGRSGAGKTTLFDLMLGYVKPSMGEILINGKNIKNISPTSLRKRFSLVSQEPLFFTGSLFDNLLFEDKKEARRKLREWGLEDLMLKFSKSYDKILTDLSGGERQIIEIARALLREPDVLILDEATSNMDRELEKEVLLCVKKAMKGRIVFFVAHKGGFEGRDINLEVE